MRIRIFQRGKISGSRTVDHQIFSTYTFTKCQIFVLRKHSGESISYPFAFGIEGLSNFWLHPTSVERIKKTTCCFLSRQNRRIGSLPLVAPELACGAGSRAWLWGSYWAASLSKFLLNLSSCILFPNILSLHANFSRTFWRIVDNFMRPRTFDDTGVDIIS